MEKEDFFIRRVRELADLSYRRDMITYTDFLGLNEQNLIAGQKFQDLGVTLEWYGGYEHAERQLVAFHPDALPFTPEYPIDCLLVRPAAPKFADRLTHRDFLGAILNLGVDRSVLGDILIDENRAYVFCLNRLSDFLAENLYRVKHTSVQVQKIENPVEMPKPRMVPVTGTCASVRLDALIALAFGASRSSLTGLIEGGQVYVNGKLVTRGGFEPKPGDIISVRHKGRFLYEETAGRTKKGRCSVRLMRYES